MCTLEMTYFKFCLRLSVLIQIGCIVAVQRIIAHLKTRENISELFWKIHERFIAIFCSMKSHNPALITFRKIFIIMGCPGRNCVLERRGPLGFELRQDPIWFSTVDNLEKDSVISELVQRNNGISLYEAVVPNKTGGSYMELVLTWPLSKCVLSAINSILCISLQKTARSLVLSMTVSISPVRGHRFK